MLTRAEITAVIQELLAKYHAESALLFGSYARGEETPSSDVDLIVFGGSQFKKTHIFAFAEDLRYLTGKDADVFEICELDQGTSFYKEVMRDGIKITQSNHII